MTRLYIHLSDDDARTLAQLARRGETASATDGRLVRDRRRSDVARLESVADECAARYVMSGGGLAYRIDNAREVYKHLTGLYPEESQ